MSCRAHTCYTWRTRGAAARPAVGSPRKPPVPDACLHPAVGPPSHGSRELGDHGMGRRKRHVAPVDDARRLARDGRPNGGGRGQGTVTAPKRTRGGACRAASPPAGRAKATREKRPRHRCCCSGRYIRSSSSRYLAVRARSFRLAQEIDVDMVPRRRFDFEGD